MVSHWLGRTSIRITVDAYGHLIPASWDRCRDTMQTTLPLEETCEVTELK
ncbi:hypothetical protein [Streptomyces sp. 3N207]